MPSMETVFKGCGQLTYKFDIWPWRVTLTWACHLSKCALSWDAHACLNTKSRDYTWDSLACQISSLCLHWFKSCGYLTFDKVCIFISIMPISSPNPTFYHLLESSHRLVKHRIWWRNERTKFHLKLILSTLSGALVNACYLTSTLHGSLLIKHGLDSTIVLDANCAWASVAVVWWAAVCWPVYSKVV